MLRGEFDVLQLLLIPLLIFVGGKPVKDGSVEPLTSLFIKKSPLQFLYHITLIRNHVN